MGFRCFGPVNGNDINEMIEVLENLKDVKGPVMLHVVTKKGKGYKPAEEKPTKFHGIGIFDVETGDSLGKASCMTFTQAFSKALLTLAEKDPSITAITAAMPEGTGLDSFRDKYPSRYFDVGIAEEPSPNAATTKFCMTFACRTCPSSLRWTAPGWWARTAPRTMACLT